MSLDPLSSQYHKGRHVRTETRSLFQLSWGCDMNVQRFPYLIVGWIYIKVCFLLIQIRSLGAFTLVAAQHRITMSLLCRCYLPASHHHDVSKIALLWSNGGWGGGGRHVSHCLPIITLLNKWMYPQKHHLYFLSIINNSCTPSSSQYRQGRHFRIGTGSFPHFSWGWRHECSNLLCIAYNQARCSSFVFPIITPISTSDGPIS